jgi:hypothetical protein
MDNVLVEYEQRGPVSVLAMVYRPYNLLGPKLMDAMVVAFSAAGGRWQPGDRAAQWAAAFLRRRRCLAVRRTGGARRPESVRNQRR